MGGVGWFGGGVNVQGVVADSITDSLVESSVAGFEALRLNHRRRIEICHREWTRIVDFGKHFDKYKGHSIRRVKFEYGELKTTKKLRR